MVSFEDYNDEKPTTKEFEILGKLLKPGQKLLLLSNLLYPADYADQLKEEV